MKNKRSFLLAILYLTKFFLPFLLTHPVYELHRDEYLYYAQGQHPAVGYLENPPIIGWMAAISSALGGSEFWIKFWPSLFGVLTMWVTVRMVKEFGGNLFAQLLAASGFIFSAYLRIHFLFQPNFLDIFFWSLSAYFLLRFIRTNNEKYIYFLAFSLALGWYGKYSILFFIIALLLSLLFSPYRTVYVKRSFWKAFLLACVVVLPNLYWQYQHNWPLFHHMKELQETQLQHLNRIDFVKEQILMLLPLSVIWMAGFAWLLRQPKYRVIAFVYLFIILLLMIGSGKGYYALGAYPMLLAAGSVWAEKISVRRTALRYAFALFCFILALPFIPLLLPLQSPEDMAASNKKFGLEKIGLLRWEDGKDHPLQQDFADMLGWKELTEKTENLYNKLPDSTKAQTTVYCRNYGLAGGMRYYAKEDDFRRKIISDNGTFLLWIPNRLYFKDLIFIGEDMPGTDDAVFQQFEKKVVVDSCTNSLSRQYGIKIIHFQNANDSAWVIAQKGLKAMKSRFGQ